jgi:tRNA G18 (ribose-2'-O)-methylase SpoU
VSPAERVADPDDPRLRDFLHLRDTRLRTSFEAEHGLFLAEGETTIRRALAAGYEPRAVLGTEAKIAALGEVGAPAYICEVETLRAATGYDVHRGALASFARLALPPVPTIRGTARRVVVLEDLVDTTNLGLIFRSTAALGWDAALLTPRSADPLYRRAVKTSMGAVFTLPWTRIDHREGPGILRDAGFAIAVLSPDGDVELAGFAAPERLALVMGSEGPGVSTRWREAADHRVRIAMQAGVDSLNVAAAAAIALHALR